MKMREHLSIVSGKSKYLDDLTLPGTLYLGVVRSPYARAKVNLIIGPSGEHHLFITGKELNALLPAVPMQNAYTVKMPVLAQDRVNFVGQPVAAVVGDDRYQVTDLVEQVQVDYEVLRPVVDVMDAIKGEPIHGRTNVALDQELSGGDLSALKQSEVVVERRIEQDRIAGNPMETRGCLVSYTDGKLLVYASTQSAFRVRSNLQESLGLPPENIVVHAPPNVGGGFGSKLNSPSEYVIAAYAAMKLHRPVKWIETRREHVIGLSQGRGMVGTVRLHGRRDGTILGVEGEVIVNVGAYAFANGLTTPSFIASNLTGPYRMKFAKVRSVGVYTNIPPYVIYRGAGRPEATLFHETLVEDFAQKIGMDPIEVRRKNMVTGPFETPLGLKFDDAGYVEVFERGVKYYRELTNKYGNRVGVAFFNELIRTSPGEGAKVVVGKGKVQVIVGSGHHGQGYQTSFSALVATELGISPDAVEVKTGTTDGLKEGVGSFGSRAAAVGGAAIVEACRAVRKKISEAGLEFGEALKGETLYEAEVYVKSGDIFAPGFHIAAVDVDKETLTPYLLEYVAVDDVGRVLVEDEVEGQVVGGVMQGVSQVFYERAAYDSEGNPSFSSIGDTGVPKSVNFTYRVRLDRVEHRSSLASGVRGVGEAGTVGALAATFIALEKVLGRKLGRTPVTAEMIR